MKIAIIGSGIAGNVAAYHLNREHEITLFEAGDHLGGHTHTHDIDLGFERYAVDTGFIVFNDWTYPSFIALLDELGVASQPSEMSFSVKCERSGLEYNGNNLNSLFAQRRNLLRPSFHRMLRDIVRFNREAAELLEQDADEPSLGAFLARQGYGQEMIERYLVPMGAAIWSANPVTMYAFPARFFLRFFRNHGLLSVNHRPTWRVIEGGSRAYVDKLTAPFADRVRLRTPVRSVRRLPTHVEVCTESGGRERFDALFLACHSDQALALLADPRPPEREVLGAIPYQANEAVLHTDASVLPKRRLAWASWNYHILPQDQGRVALTYHMNRLQGLKAPVELCVTLNNSAAIDPERVLKRVEYHHPVFTPSGVAAQARQGELNSDRTYYCGAYWRNGFHEDGVVSALNALRHFQENQHHAQLPLRRAS